MINRLLYLGLTAILLASCSNEMSPNEYTDWLKTSKSGFVKNKESKGVLMNLQYVPARAMSETEPNEATVEKYILKVKPGENAERGLLSYASKDMDDYQYLSRYYNEGGVKEFHLQIGEKSYTPSEYYFEDYQGLVDYNAFTVVFRSDDLTGEEDRVFVWDDQILNLGITKFRISSTDIQKEKAIKIVYNDQ